MAEREREGASEAAGQPSEWIMSVCRVSETQTNASIGSSRVVVGAERKHTKAGREGSGQPGFFVQDMSSRVVGPPVVLTTISSGIRRAWFRGVGRREGAEGIVWGRARSASRYVLTRISAGAEARTVANKLQFRIRSRAAGSVLHAVGPGPRLVFATRVLRTCANRDAGAVGDETSVIEMVSD
jgi:hypothetical protein